MPRPDLPEGVFRQIYLDANQEIEKKGKALLSFSSNCRTQDAGVFIGPLVGEGVNMIGQALIKKAFGP
jgi:hypothetical protein